MRDGSTAAPRVALTKILYPHSIVSEMEKVQKVKGGDEDGASAGADAGIRE